VAGSVGVSGVDQGQPTSGDHPAAQPSDNPLVEVKDISKCFGDTAVLEDVSLRVEPGEVVCVIGRSGSGKSTLLRCLNLLVEPSSGSLEFRGTEVGRWPQPKSLIALGRRRALRRHRRRIGMVFQSFELFPHLSATDNVALGLRYALGEKSTEARAVSRALLEQVGLAEFTDRKPGQLSGGQKQRVAIARALAMKPELLLLDEPTSALDPEMVGEVLDLLVNLAQDGMTMVVVTHEIGFAAKVADRMVVIDEGRIVEVGKPQDLLVAPRAEATRSLLRALTAYHETSTSNEDDAAQPDGQPVGD